MHPAPSLIVLTTASGAGYGLLFLLALGAALGLVPPEPWLGLTGLALALGLVTAGFVASLYHLGRPERAWRALTQWRSSWLSREGLMALLTYVPALLLALGWVGRGTVAGPFALCALLAAAGAAITVYCTGMIYASLRPIRQWHQPLVPPVYLAFALLTGALLLHLVLAVFAAPRGWAGDVVVLAVLLAVALKALYWRAIDQQSPIATAESATGLGVHGRVRMVEPPHTQSNYLLDEMGYRVARKHARRLRRLVHGFGLAGAGLLTIAALFASGGLAPLLALLAAGAGGVAVVIERWLFFAEASHTVMLYYGRPAA